MSLHSSLEYTELNLRCNFSLALRECRIQRNQSQGDLAHMLVNKKIKTADEYEREFICWKKKISNWENGYSLPNLATFFYLITIFGRKLSDASIKGNKLLEEVQLEDTEYHAET